MTKAKKVLILAFYGGLILLFLFCIKLHIPCLIKKIFHIPCPGCGLTRAFIAIFNFKFIKSFTYNILAFPLFCFLIIIFILDLYDLFFNKNYLIKFMNKIISNYSLIIIFLIIGFLINIYRDI